MANWLKSLPKPVGLMTFADDRSQQVIDTCKIAGVNVPDEVAVIGVDNDDLICDLSDPPLSSIAFNTERAGYEAAELLDKLMAGKKVVNQTIVVRPTHIVTRQSTNIIAIEDRVVADAARFIRQHSRKIIQVSDVTSAVMVSRCTLERRFRRALGKSVLKELKRVRTDQITQMLMETNLSVSQIASTLGYLSATHIARYFRQEKGISPLAYRKKYGRK
jgi:LacI family transcriptional regulator